jgi:colanic acid/amylovoran biosynthesis glycosyltransferase
VVLSSTRPIRLGYLVSQYPAVNHTHILREIRGLRGLGFEVHVASIRPPDRPPAQLTEIEKVEAGSTFTVLRAGPAAILGAHVMTFLRRPLKYLAGLAFAIQLSGPNFRATTSNLFYFAEAVVAGRYFERLALTHVHTHFSSTVALLLARVFPISFSATIHGSAEFEDPVGFHLREKVARAQFVRAISDYGAGQLKRASDPEHWPKIEVVRLGVDTSVFTPRPVPPGTPRIELLYVGSLAPPKGHAILIPALDRLIKEGHTAIHLRLVGDGPLRPRLEEMIAARNLKHHVTLEGACNQDRVLEFYRQASLFVLPSLAEGVPVVLMEAMPMEIPCLATAITGVPELIRHGIDGWLIPPGSEQELAVAIAKLIADPKLRQRLGQAGRKRVQQHYELGSNIEQLAELYREHLSR